VDILHVRLVAPFENQSVSKAIVAENRGQISHLNDVSCARHWTEHLTVVSVMSSKQLVACQSLLWVTSDTINLVDHITFHLSGCRIQLSRVRRRLADK